MSNTPFFSIIMPIYNVEKHLTQAIDSVLTQTYKEFELILVDDCSPDNCLQLCEEYAKKDNRIKVIHHEENKGLSAARNTGLDNAIGCYIWFMDSDDYVDSYLLEKVYESINKNKAEVVLFGLVEEYYDQNGILHHTKEICPKEMYLENPKDIHEQVIDLEMQTLYGYAWNKFYEVEYLKKIGLRYEKVTLIEDILFNVQYFMEIKGLNVLSIMPYHYNKRMDNSLTSKFVPDYYKLHQKRVELIYEQYLYWNACDDNVKNKLATIYIRYIFSALQRNCDKRSKMKCIQRRKWIQNLFKENLFNALIPYAKPQSKVMKMMLFALKKKSAFLCLVGGRFIYIIKNKCPMIFSKVKQNR